MKKTYYDTNLKTFIFGMIFGAVEIVLFLYLKKNVSEGLAWALHAGMAGLLAAAWGMSHVLRKIHDLEESEEGDKPKEQVSTLIAPEVTKYEVIPGAMTFPYATKALHAASLAASKFWTDYDPDRPPLQKTVQGFITERGIPVRQAAELASAIKPDNMSDVPDTSAGK